MELHFFRIYQFFERWALLVKNRDIEARDVDRYMRAYKPWYFLMFIDEWTTREKDPYIKISLNEIRDHVRPKISEELLFEEQIKAVKAEILELEIQSPSMPKCTRPEQYELPV